MIKNYSLVIYFDIYLDINDGKDEDKKITISSLSKCISNSTSKYLKKNIEYIIDFPLDHLIKLDPNINAVISIYNNTTRTITLNLEKTTVILEGNNYKIKSNEDTMIYFYGKLFNNIKQMKIDINNNNKNIQIKSNKKIFFAIDIGF